MNDIKTLVRGTDLLDCHNVFSLSALLKGAKSLRASPRPVVGVSGTLMMARPVAGVSGTVMIAST